MTTDLDRLIEAEVGGSRAARAPAPSVSVKPLEWVDMGDGKSFRALLPIIGSVRVEPYGCCGWWEVLWSMPGQCDKLIPDVFDNPNEAKAAAQADYEARIRAVTGIRALEAENQRLRETLTWYGEQARLARLIHSEGDAGRRNLAADGGSRARAALSSTEASHDD